MPCYTVWLSILQSLLLGDLSIQQHWQYRTTESFYSCWGHCIASLVTNQQVPILRIFIKQCCRKYPILCNDAFYSLWNVGGGTPDIVTTSSCDDEKKGGAGSWTLDRNQQLEVPRLFFCRSMQVSIPKCSNMQEQDSGTMDRVCNLLEAFFLQINIPNIPKLTNKVIL